MKSSALLALVSAIFLALLAMPANAQATRTWVSGVGDDANPCSRTAPCKTFAGAISKTASAGEINCLDPGGFGAVTIAKSITIDCEGVSNGGVLVSGTPGITVAPASGSVVTLRGLDFDGIGSGTIGVSITGAATVNIENCKIYGFATAGVSFVPTAAGGTLVLTNTRINNNATGVLLDGSSGAVSMTLRDDIIDGNTGNGITVQTSGASAGATIDSSTLAFNGGTGVTVNGSAATAIIGNSTVTGNSTGVSVPLGRLFSFKNNQIGGNVTDGTPIAAYPVPSTTHDFNGDGYSDILWRDTSGDLAMWFMNGTQVIAGGVVATVPTVWSVVGQRDFNGDGYSDILWRDTSGNLAIWLMDGGQMLSGAVVSQVPTIWSVVGTGDFNGDGKGDILWRDTSGDLAMWFMNGTQVIAGGVIGTVPTVWSVVGTGDFNGDGKTDILWRDTSGDLAIWLMSGGQELSGVVVGTVPTTWSVVGTGDFNGDGKSDILWRDTSGNLAIWFMNGTQVIAGGTIAQVPTVWSVAETGDFNGDGKSDILWTDTSGDLAIWLMNGGQMLSPGVVVGTVPTVWTVQGLNAD